MDKIPQLLGHYKDTQYLMLPEQESCFPVSLVGARPCLSLYARREPSPLLYTSGGQGRLQDSAWLMRYFCQSHRAGGIIFSAENLRIQKGGCGHPDGLWDRAWVVSRPPAVPAQLCSQPPSAPHSLRCSPNTPKLCFSSPGHLYYNPLSDLQPVPIFIINCL